MVYLVGIIGLLSGFVCGQMLLYFLLRHKTREQLISDQGLKWMYGTLNWLLAAAGAYGAVVLYTNYFGMT